jgi:hypothetical protein
LQDRTAFGASPWRTAKIRAALPVPSLVPSAPAGAFSWSEARGSLQHETEAREPLMNWVVTEYLSCVCGCMLLMRCSGRAPLRVRSGRRGGPSLLQLRARVFV